MNTADRTWTQPPRWATPGQARRRGVLLGKAALGLIAAVVLATTGYGWLQLHGLAGLLTSSALDGEPGSTNGDTNILIMGLDSRLDENGNPLPQDIYNALHAGDQQDGGYNANVLILLHVPGDGSKATAISIPRDDYVDLAGCPDGECKGKIKQAYGLAFDEQAKQLAAQQGIDRTQREQQARDASRKAEVATVRQFLGGVPIDHFVEVTMVAFFQVAQVVQPITVCVNEDTQDSYSGAHFHQGQQQINAEQAVAFVRQRRDYVHPELNFTDLDRARRQQAFIASLAHQLHQGSVFTSPSKLQNILDAAQHNIALDAKLDPATLVQQASTLTGGNITFATLPIDHFGKDAKGNDVNFVNLTKIRATVAQLLGTAPAPPRPAAPQATVDVVNATSRHGLANQVRQFLAGAGFTLGTTSTSTRHLPHSLIYQSPAASAATSLSTALGGVGTQHSADVQPGHVRLVLGADFQLPTTAGGPASLTPTRHPAPPPVETPAQANPTTISGGGVPCVK